MQLIRPSRALDQTLAALLKQVNLGQETLKGGVGAVEQWAMVLKSLTDSSVPGTTTAFQPFNLDLVGKLLLPLLTPLQNRGAYGVKAGQPGDSREYRAITGKNLNKNSGYAPATTSVNSTSTNTAGRGNVIDYQYASRKKFFGKVAPEAAITWELYKSSGPFNALGKATIASLITAKELEERRMIGDCLTALGTTGTPTGTPSITGGVLTNAASPYTVNCIALNYWGWWYYVADGLPVADLTNTGGQIPTQAIGTASAGITIASGIAGSITMKVPPTKGAWAYLWTIKHSGGTFTLAGATTAPTIVITAEGTVAASTLSTVDGSTLDIQGNPTLWDGLVSQILLDPDLPGQYVDCSTAANGNGVFTTTGSGSGVSQVETILAAIARLYNLSPTLAVMSPATLSALSNIAIGSSAPAYRLNVEADSNGLIKAGTILSSLRNQYMGTEVEIVSEPVMADGKIIFYTEDIDYPDSGVTKNLELNCAEHFLQDFFARTTDVAPPGPWAIKTYGAPILYFGKACGVIDNVQVGPNS